MIPPRAGDFVDERLGAVAVLEHQCDRHVAPREDDQQHREREQVSTPCTTAIDSHRPRTSEGLAKRKDHQDELESGEPGGEPQRGKSGFGDHFSSVFPALCSAARLPSSGGM